MARGRFISLCRRCSQFTAGLSTAARKRAITNQPMKVLTCQSKKIATRTPTVVSKATATVRITCEVEALAHPAPWLGMEAFCAVGVVSGLGWGSAPVPLFDDFPSFTSVSPTVLWAATLQPPLVDSPSKSSSTGLLPSGSLIGSHPPL